MNGELPSLDLALVTHQPEGIERVAKMILPPVDGITYIVSWQAHQNVPVPDALAARDDVKIYRTDSRGISNNRNNALDHCEAEIVLFSDDDLTYNPEDLQALRILYGERPELELTTLMSNSGVSSRFPGKEIKLTYRFPKGYSVASVEIAFRCSVAASMRCCPELGIGSGRLLCGEDEVFLLSAIHHGIDCRFIPLTICTHQHESTGSQAQYSEGNLLGFGCVIALQYPLTFPLRVPLKAWRVWRAGKAPFWKALSALTRGALMAPALKKRNKKYLW